ncbi:MAG: hypothetical protein IT559_08500 [Alphaproteobacteria bacterium]|nr:hypothetical protein [Alphaproteobacteria bacterium]
MLNDKDLARLTNTLEVPMIVQDILGGELLLNPEIEYGLHEVLSNYQPDAALLCMALSARKIASFCLKQPGGAKLVSMAVMKMECDRLIEDYAELWLAHARQSPVDDTLLMDTLAQIPEDLESLVELLETNAAALQDYAQSGDIETLCEILAIQGQAQALIAETFVEIIEEREEIEIPAMENIPGTVFAGGNVIAFPLRSARA